MLEKCLIKCSNSVTGITQRMPSIALAMLLAGTMSIEASNSLSFRLTKQTSDREIEALFLLLQLLIYSHVGGNRYRV